MTPPAGITAAGMFVTYRVSPARRNVRARDGSSSNGVACWVVTNGGVRAALPPAKTRGAVPTAASKFRRQRRGSELPRTRLTSTNIAGDGTQLGDGTSHVHGTS